jgi:hypothetical protein
VRSQNQIRSPFQAARQLRCLSDAIQVRKNGDSGKTSVGIGADHSYEASSGCAGNSCAPGHHNTSSIFFFIILFFIFRSFPSRIRNSRCG